METLREVLQPHGRSVALYSDRHSIFRVNHPDHEGEVTQFTRALQTLDIQPIHARTPQAKGRVETPSIRPGSYRPNAPSGNPLPTILGVAIPPQHPPQNPLPDPPQEDISALLKRDICELG